MPRVPQSEMGRPPVTSHHHLSHCLLAFMAKLHCEARLMELLSSRGNAVQVAFVPDHISHFGLNSIALREHAALSWGPCWSSTCCILCVCAARQGLMPALCFWRG